MNKLRLVIIMLFTAFLLCGCGKSDDEPAKTPEGIMYIDGYNLDSNGGEFPGGRTIKSCMDLCSEPLPVYRTGYIFNGWNSKIDGSGVDSGSDAGSNRDHINKWYAQWRPAAGEATIIFDCNGGGAIANISVPKGEPIALPVESDTVRDGFTLVGWYDGKNQYFGQHFPGVYVVKSDITLKAMWVTASAEISTVSFDPDGGIMLDPLVLTVPHGTVVRLPSAGRISKEGYEFEGWIIPSSPNYKMSYLNAWGNSALKASWKPRGN